MVEKRIKISNVVKNQLPSYVREEFPLVSEFLSQYYLSQEFKGAPADLIQNIDQYIKIDESSRTPESVILASNISFVDTTIYIESLYGTRGFPDSYGILQIDDEIITYTGKTFDSFTGCIRGFSAITSLKGNNDLNQLVFKDTDSQEHAAGAVILNLSDLFLKEFLLKTKYQILPGFQDRILYSELNQSLFIKQAKDFYNSKGTDKSFSILFGALYGEEVEIIRPKDFLLKPSNANWKNTLDLVVESISGNPIDIQDSTLRQDTYKNISKARAPISKVELISSNGNNEYYRLSLDSGYNRDLEFNGAVYGEFSVHPRTYLIGNSNSNASTLDVDSTIGFPEYGDLRVTYDDATVGTISYTSKSINQFFGCSGIVGIIPDASPIDIDTYAYAPSFKNPSETVKLRITSVLNDIVIDRQTYNYGVDDEIKIITLGKKSNNYGKNNWFFNTAQSYEVKSLSLVDASDMTYSILLNVTHSLRIGDKILLSDDSGLEKQSIVSSVLSEKSFTVKGQGELSLSRIYTIRRSILKVESQIYPELSDVCANIQNVYEYKRKVLASTNSLPYYYNQPINATDRSIVFSGNFIGSEFEITTNSDHGFYSGECVYYTPEKYGESLAVYSSLFSEGIYYIKRVSSTKVKFARSKSDLYNSKFVSLDNLTPVNNNKIEYFKFKGKKLTPQKIFREISEPIASDKVNATNTGSTGIFINGVELQNYKSTDVINYGKLEKVDIIASGSDWDIINPPKLIIDDLVGVGATGYCSVKGSLSKIQIVDPGFGYSEMPSIKITGGNGYGAVVEPVLTLVKHSATFNSELSSNLVGIGTTQSTIEFSTYHKFTTSERVLYKTNGQKAISGLTTNSEYYVSVKTPYRITLHKNIEDSISGINTITLLSYGIGNHEIEAFTKKNIISSVNVKNSGSGYENKKRTVSVSGISTASDTINITNHNYSDGEIVYYSTLGTPIGGLTNGTEYYVTFIDNDNFKLSNVGIASTLKDYYYTTKQYIKLTSTGSGIHEFNYPEIKVEIEGKIGISSVSQDYFSAEVQPIFRGEITSVHLSNNGVGYGSSEVINFDRQPTFELISGSDCQLTPVVSNGKIIEVLINSKGKNYNSPPELAIIGSGVGAVLTPIISNGEVVSVKVIQGGIGYIQGSAFITVTPSGARSSTSFRAKITSWRVNLFEKYFNSISNDDGFLAESLDQKSGLKYTHLYAPRKLREIIYSSDQSGKVLFGKYDLKKARNTEVTSTDHSPIIGWAYDGHPIYGPYGYTNKSGGSVLQMKSGYKLDLKSNRPPLSIFPEGFFIEDYTYKKISDEDVLDEKNGRFCVTPEFPQGTYAYFSTFNTLPDSSGKFLGYKRPTFPYVIGDSYNSEPNEFNFKSTSNQEDFDLNTNTWLRNTSTYNLLEGTVDYKYLQIPNKLNQTSKIKYVSSGSIESVGIFTGGRDYKVGDRIKFDNTGTDGFGAEATVSSLEGKKVDSISVASTSISNFEISVGTDRGEFLLFSNYNHNFKNNDIVRISGMNTSSSLIEGSYRVGVSSNTLYLKSGVGTAGYTGIVTYFTVFGNLNYPYVKVNDVLSIGTENVKVLKVHKEFSSIRVLRQTEGTVGISHTASEVLYENSRKLSINVGYNTTFDYKLNKEIYFYPQESVGVGTLSGVGIGSTLRTYSPVGIVSIFVPTKSILLPSHGLETGDQITYYTNSGSPIGVSTNGISTSLSLSNGSTLYVAKLTDDLIGIATVKVGLGSTGTFVGINSTTSNTSTLFFTGIGTGSYHSFKTNYQKLTANATKNVVTVSTAETHGLSIYDKVSVNINPNANITYIIAYDDYHRKMLVNPKSFSSVGITTSTGNINIPNHGFVRGQKVLHTSSSPAIGLLNEKFYYIIDVDSDNIKLSENYYDSLSTNPSIVGISSASNGILSAINPPIKAYKDSTVVFDVSDSSLSYIKQSSNYSAFKLEFFTDSNFKDVFEKTELNTTFEIERSGKVGISSNAKVTLKVNKYFPQKLYYKLIPVYESDLPTEKVEISIDTSIDGYGSISIDNSLYNGTHTVKSSSNTLFTYDLEVLPESVSYASSTSDLRYTTTSTTATGPIDDVEINSRGKNYYSLPTIYSINSGIGTEALLDVKSTSIGKIERTKIVDIGFDFSSDKTVRPTAILPQIIKIDSLASFESIGISSFGKGYNSPPKLLVFDGKTNKLVPEADIRYNLGDINVKIYKNVDGINDITPIILPTQNTNGVGISSISYDSVTNNVTVTLSVGFSTTNSFPFEVGDKVLIENIGVGINSEGKGYNSENYDYKLFIINNVDANIGGIGTVSYSLSGLLNSSEYPGIHDIENSVGRIIPQKHFPIFNPVLKKNDYKTGEIVESGTSTGIVENWDPNTNYLRVSTKDEFKVGETIVGKGSKTIGIASSTTPFITSYVVEAYSDVTSGWNSDSGILNNNLQRLHDNEYYQNFSYSIKSKVDYDTWKDAVSSLNHAAGFRKFADLQIESKLEDGLENSLVVGLSTQSTSFEVINDIIGFANLNCVYDFDLVKENSLKVAPNIISNEITFTNRVLSDYLESVGNRVLTIDDISQYFNSNPRPSKFSAAKRFYLSDARAQKYIVYVRDKRYLDRRQIMLVSLLHDNSFGFISQYGRVESGKDLGSFDFVIEGIEGILTFYPNFYSVNDYDITTLSYNIHDDLITTGEVLNCGGIVEVDSTSSVIGIGSTNLISIPNTFRSIKVFTEIISDNNEYQSDELLIIHDGNDVDYIEYGQLSTTSLDTYGNSGFGTYYPKLSGSQIKLDFVPRVGVAATVNTIFIALKDESSSGIGTVELKHSLLEGRSTSIASTASPVPVVISDYIDNYDGAYAIVQVSDITNNKHFVSEVTLVDDDNEVYLSEFTFSDGSGIGTIGAQRNSKTQLIFTPNPNINVNVKVFLNALRYEDDERDSISIDNTTIETSYGQYFGTEREIKKSFEIYHKNYKIFERDFDGSNSSVVDISENTIQIPNHFFVSGEKLIYSHSGAGSTQAIGIAATNFVGIGVTTKLPSDVYAVKVNENIIKLARSAEDSLLNVPKVINITNVGIGTSHTLTATNQNARVIIAIDNIIQSPIVSTALTSSLSVNLFSTDDILYFNSGISSFFGGDLIKIGNEIMKISSVGVGSTNAIRVQRPWLGTNASAYSNNTLVTKVTGNFNIIKNTLNFVEAPYGRLPFSSSTNAGDDIDWSGISTSSNFQGRTFLRSGSPNSSYETYSRNYIFDDISTQFNGSERNFNLKSNSSNITGISSEKAIILINDVFQGPGLTYDYTLNETAGITSIRFTGTATSFRSDVNTSNLPIGGVIISVGSSQGFGYQPLVSAGGTAIVSIAGTISSISIGNSGSGYRSGSQIVRVGVGTSSTGTPKIEFIGTAVVSNGRIVSVAITNPGSGYTSTKAPYVVIDDPLSYSDIPLKYTSSSSGFGTEATVDVVVGSGSSIIEFELKNNGYGYGQGDILTIPIGGITGIPTTSGYKEFQVTVQKTFSDKFTGWSLGELQILDNLNELFDGERVVFPLKLSKNFITIRSARGSNVNIEDTLLIFINDILQVPGKAYKFPGGSTITFTEAPKEGDTSKIIFYKGSGVIDVIDKNIMETVKVGDELTISYDPSIGQQSILQENERTVSSINSTDIVNTNPYFGPGNIEDNTLVRPVVWCRQTEDKIIDGLEVGKDRIIYEPIISPFAYIIKSVGIGSTTIYVDNIRPFFNPQNENDVTLEFQKKITITSQDTKISAAATALVSTAGTIHSISLNDGGIGYDTSPIVTIQNPVGLGTTQRATAVASISPVTGIITSLVVTGPGTGYLQSKPPVILIEPPTLSEEINIVNEYKGDSGVIVGFGITTTVGLENKIIFDLHIPTDSYLRSTNVTGIAVTLSSLSRGDYFVVYNSNVGSSSTAIYSGNLDGGFVAIGTQFVDNVYQVDTSELVTANVTGIGTTIFRRVFAKIIGISSLTFSSTYVTFDSSIIKFDSAVGVGSTSYSGIITQSNYFGNFSWGRISIPYRSGENNFNFYGTNGVGGISSSSIVRRTNPLKYTSYIQ